MIFAKIKIDSEWLDYIGLDHLDIDGKICIVNSGPDYIGWVSVSLMTIGYDRLIYIDMSLRYHHLTKVNELKSYRYFDITKFFPIDNYILASSPKV